MAAVSNYGGLGSFGAHGLTPSAIEEVIAELRSLTDKPFAMNLSVSMEDEGAPASDGAAFKRSQMNADENRDGDRSGSSSSHEAKRP